MPWEKQFNVDAVLEKTMQAFWSRGYAATSMQDLVDCTGVNRGSLYATYGDKHALFLAALQMYDERMRRKVLADFEARYSPSEAIRQIFLGFAENVSESGGNRGCFLTNTALELASHDPEACRIVAHAQEELEEFFARMITLGKKIGEIAPHIKPREAGRGLLASLIGLVVLTRSRPDKELLQSIIDDALHRLS